MAVDIADPADGEVIGRGSYATVKRIAVNGQLCAAKQMHCLLFSNAVAANLPLLKRALKECLLLSNLQHPNIVQFVGVHHRQGSVTLVMEYLSLLLADCLEMYPNLPIACIQISFGMLAKAFTISTLAHLQLSTEISMSTTSCSHKTLLQRSLTLSHQ